MIDINKIIEEILLEHSLKYPIPSLKEKEQVEYLIECYHFCSSIDINSKPGLNKSVYNKCKEWFQLQIEEKEINNDHLKPFITNFLTFVNDNCK